MPGPGRSSPPSRLATERAARHGRRRGGRGDASSTASRATARGVRCRSAARAFLAAQGDGAYADAALTGLDAGGLARIDVPVAILTGTASEPFYAPIARAVVARVPGAHLVTLDGLRHTAPISDPEPVAAAILGALTAAGIPSHPEAQP